MSKKRKKRKCWLCKKKVDLKHPHIKLIDPLRKKYPYMHTDCYAILQKVLYD